MANPTRTLYTGVTSNFFVRVWQHKNGANKHSFTYANGCTKLVYFSEFSRKDDAIAFEKKVKGKSRGFKLALVEESNSRWNDLAYNWYE